MIRIGSLFIVGVVMLSLSCFLSNCGGGGGASTSRGGGPDATLTASNAQQVGNVVTQAVKLVVPTVSLGDMKASSISSVKRAPLLKILEKIISTSGKNFAHKNMSTHAVMNEDCEDGGNITLDIDSVDAINKIIIAEVNVNSCTIGPQILNGTMEVEYVVDSIDAITNPTLDNLKDFEKVTITTSGFTYTNTENNDNVTLSDLTLILKEFTYNGDLLSGGSITMGGIVAGILAGETINVECDSLGLLFTSDPAGGLTVSISGGIKASCLDGWIRMVTNSPIFLPVNAHCPTGGNIAASAGENTVNMIIAEDSKISIYFNNDLVQTFNSCDDVIGFCSG